MKRLEESASVATQKCNKTIGSWKGKPCLKGSHWLKDYITFWSLKQKNKGQIKQLIPHASVKDYC